MIPTSLQSLGLDKFGLNQAQALFYNLSYEELFQHEMDPALKGSEKVTLTKSGAVAVETGKFTGRSPKDKYIVKDQTSENTVWWNDKGSDNKPLSVEAWQHLKDISVRELNGKKLYVMDG